MLIKLKLKKSSNRKILSALTNYKVVMPSFYLRNYLDSDKYLTKVFLKEKLDIVCLMIRLGEKN